MKVAYIGKDLSCIRSFSFFQSKNIEVTYFLSQGDVTPTYRPFNQTDILVEGLMIDPDANNQTQAQKFFFEKFKSDYQALESELGSEAIRNQEYVEGTSAKSTAAPVISDLNTIIDIQYDSKNKKVLIEVEKVGVEEFNFILLEQHILISLELEKKNIHLVSKNLKTNSVWMSFNFAVDYVQAIKNKTLNSSFFMVLDSERESIIDNWLHCQLVENELRVSSFQPYTQLMNPAFQKFASDRIRTQISKKIEFLKVKELKDISLTTVGANHLKSFISIKSSAPVPNFSFWTDEQINSYLKKNILKKINKLNPVNSAVAPEASV